MHNQARTISNGDIKIDLLRPAVNGGVITDAGGLYTVNGGANADEHGPFQSAMKH